MLAKAVAYAVCASDKRIAATSRAGWYGSNPLAACLVYLSLAGSDDR